MRSGFLLLGGNKSEIQVGLIADKRGILGKLAYDNAAYFVTEFDGPTPLTRMIIDDAIGRCTQTTEGTIKEVLDYYGQSKLATVQPRVSTIPDAGYHNVQLMYWQLQQVTDPTIRNSRIFPQVAQAL